MSRVCFFPKRLTKLSRHRSAQEKYLVWATAPRTTAAAPCCVRLTSSAVGTSKNFSQVQKKKSIHQVNH